MDRESSDALYEIRLLSIYIVAKSIASINHGQLIMQINFMVCSRVPINAIIRLKFDDHYDIARQNVFKVDNSCLDIYSSRLVIMIQLIISSYTVYECLSILILYMLLSVMGIHHYWYNLSRLHYLTWFQMSTPATAFPSITSWPSCVALIVASTPFATITCSIIGLEIRQNWFGNYHLSHQPPTF